MVVCAPIEAFAQRQIDHRGALGLLVGSGVDMTQAASFSGTQFDSGPRVPLDLGVTWAIGHEGNEALAVARATLGTPVGVGLGGWGGYRGYFGTDAWKTFFDLTALIHARPIVSVGPRIGFGAQYELSEVIGVYSGAAAYVGFGTGLRFGAELLLGFQFRTYILE